MCHVSQTLVNWYTTALNNLIWNYYTHLMPFFQDILGKSAQKEPFWILMKQEMMQWQWHQVDHMQTICTSLQTDNDASTSSLKFFTGQTLFLMPPIVERLAKGE